MVVDRQFAEKAWPGDKAVGRIIAYRGVVRTGKAYSRDARVVGVVERARDDDLIDSSRERFYVPLAHRARAELNLTIRSDGDPLALAPELRREMATLHRDIPVHAVYTMQDHIDRVLSERRFAMLLMVGFAILTLFLAAVGLYGVMAYTVTRRTREIGIRIALGAAPRRLVRWVVGEGLVLSAIGAALGVAAALASSRALETLLYQVSANDPIALAGAAAVLIGVAMLAAMSRPVAQRASSRCRRCVTSE